jgi:predicted negative regulator of RcsB-dependent stress response
MALIDETLSDEQQAALVKNWWKENGFYLAGGIILGVGGLFGWQAWQAENTRVAQEASNAFQEMAEATAQQRYNKADELHALIVSDYSGTPYAASAELTLAASLMKRNDAAAAADVLRRLINETGDDGIRNIAKLRLGRVLLQLEDYAAAAQVAAYSKDDAFTAEFADLLGDIAYAEGNQAAAITAYEQALAAAGPSFAQAGYVQVKLDSLRVGEQVLVEPASAE